MKIKFKLSNVTIGLLLVFLIFSNASMAQYYKLTTAIGVSNYQGDLSNGFISDLGTAASVGISYDLYDNFRLRANLSYLQVGGNDSKSPKASIKSRNLDFKTDIFELGLLGEIDVLNSQDYSLVPYVFGGPTIYHFNPYTIVKQSDLIEANNLNFPNDIKVGQKVYLHDIGTEGQLINNIGNYNLTQLNIQLGGGIRYKISDWISIGYEFSFRKLFTDHLDDVSSRNYISSGGWDIAINKAIAAGDFNRVKLLEKGEILAWRTLDNKGVPVVSPNGRPRGNPDANDAYFSSQVRLNFTLFSKEGKNSLGNNKLFSPRNPTGRGQLSCPKLFY